MFEHLRVWRQRRESCEARYSCHYPSKLRAVLEKRKQALAKQARLTKFTFFVFSVLAFAPTAGAIWKVWEKYPTETATAWYGVAMYVADVLQRFHH